jgi:hypothetical protein
MMIKLVNSHFSYFIKINFYSFFFKVIHNLLDHVKKSSKRANNEIEELEKRYI